MANTQKKIWQAQLAAADGALFTGTAAHTYTITSILICNTDTVSRTFRLHDVDSAGASAANNAFFFDATISASATIAVVTRIVLTGTAMIRGLASAANVVTVTGYGIDST